MRGSIEHRRYKNKKGQWIESPNWTIIIEQDPDPITGKRKQTWHTFKGSSEDAEKERTRLLHEKDTGQSVQTGRLKVSDYLDRWLYDYGKPNLSPRAYDRYESVIRVHIKPSLGRLQLTALRSNHAQALYSAMLDKGLSPRSIRYCHVVLHKALNSAIKWGLLARNVADGCDIPKAERPAMQTWDENELTIFLEASKDTEYYPLFFTALFTGARRSELLALRWQDVDLLLGQISISRGLHHLKRTGYIYLQPKSAKSNRMISLSPSTSLTLKEHYDKVRMDLAMMDKTFSDDRLVFCHLDGVPFRPNTISRAWVNLAIKAGVKRINFHAARHTHASLMLKNGIHPKVVQERLGHSSIAITLDTYSHVAPGLQQAAAARFDDLVKIGHNIVSQGQVSNSVSKSQIVK